MPLTKETQKIVNVDFMSKMKSDAVFINTSRGDIVDEDVLLAKLESCPDFWVGTDVYNGEPDELSTDTFVHPIAQHPRVYGTHHCGADTLQAEKAIGQEAVRIIKKYNAEGIIDRNNWVNAASSVDTALSQVFVRHLDKVGVLAHCFQVFASVGWNVQELDGSVFKEREA